MISSLLNKVITIQKGYDTLNSIGSPELSWYDHITTYAGVYVASGDTKLGQDGELFSYRTEFTIRYNNDTKVINNKYRVYYDGVYYKIMAIQELGIRDGRKLITVAYDAT